MIPGCGVLPLQTPKNMCVALELLGEDWKNFEVKMLQKDRVALEKDNCLGETVTRNQMNFQTALEF